MANGSTQMVQRSGARSVGDMILARKESFEAVLPKHLTVDRFLKVALASLTRTPDLAKCKPETLIMALAACSELGLEPNSPLGHAYLIPYGTDCQLVIGFKGLLALARRSGEIASVDVAVVHARDVFSYQRGDNPRIHHEPFVPKYDDTGKAVGSTDPGATIAAYMIAHLKDGSIQREVMYRHEIDAVRNGSKMKNGVPWSKHYDEMARKTVFRRGWKWLPQSTEMAKALEVDDDKPADLDRLGRAIVDVDIISPNVPAAERTVGPELAAILAEIKACPSVDGLAAWEDLTNAGAGARLEALADSDYQAARDAMKARAEELISAESGGQGTKL